MSFWSWAAARLEEPSTSAGLSALLGVAAIGLQHVGAGGPALGSVLLAAAGAGISAAVRADPRAATAAQIAEALAPIAEAALPKEAPAIATLAQALATPATVPGSTAKPG